MTTAQLEELLPRPDAAKAPLDSLAEGPDPSVVERKAFVDAMSSAVTGVTVVTTAGKAGRFGVTVSAVSSVSADPPMVLACINRRSPACTAVRENKVFCINILATEQRHIADTFAGRPAEGAPYDFNSAEWNAAISGAPNLMGAISSFDCVLETACDSGSHTIFIGKVVAIRRGAGKALLYTERAYGRPCVWN